MGNYQTKGMQIVQRMIAARQGMIKAHGNKAAHLGMKTTRQGMINSRNDMDIRPYYNIEPMAEVPNIVDYNVFAIEKQHIEQPVLGIMDFYNLVLLIQLDTAGDG
ncbi:hypothetical protein Tco_0013603 [Tanacetum coccineum]